MYVWGTKASRELPRSLWRCTPERHLTNFWKPRRLGGSLPEALSEAFVKNPKALDKTQRSFCDASENCLRNICETSHAPLNSLSDMPSSRVWQLGSARTRVFRIKFGWQACQQNLCHQLRHPAAQPRPWPPLCCPPPDSSRLGPATRPWRLTANRGLETVPKSKQFKKMNDGRQADGWADG